MSLLYSEDEQLLADSVADWVKAEHPVSRFRALRDARQTWDPELWAELVELGWPAIGLMEDAGGMGLMARCIISGALGSSLVSTPIHSVWSACDLDPEFEPISGAIQPLAWEESHTRGDFRRIEASVENGRLTGQKRSVLDGNAASRWLVAAKDGDTIGVFSVDAVRAQTTRLTRVDHRDAADVRFTAAPCTQVTDAAGLMRALDHRTLAVSAEILGAAAAAFQMTLAYLKERQQFGVAIGSFQTLQHRAVDLFIALELTRSCILAAAREPTPQRISHAKAQASDTYRLVVNEAVQFYGGIGMTDEHDIGLYMKHAVVTSRTCGTADFHRQRWASMAGY